MRCLARNRRLRALAKHAATHAATIVTTATVATASRAAVSAPGADRTVTAPERAAMVPEMQVETQVKTLAGTVVATSRVATDVRART